MCVHGTAIITRQKPTNRETLGATLSQQAKWANKPNYHVQKTITTIYYSHLLLERLRHQPTEFHEAVVDAIAATLLDDLLEEKKMSKIITKLQKCVVKFAQTYPTSLLA